MKRHFINFLQLFAPLIPLSSLIRLSGQNLFLPVYHAVEGEKPLTHIQHLYTPRGVKQFEADLDYLLSHFKPISLDDLLDVLQHKKMIAENSFFLSFDDGLREVYDIIAPILLKKGIPATFFLNPAFIDNKNLFFRYKASLLIDEIQQNTFSQHAFDHIEDYFEHYQLHEDTFEENLLAVDYTRRIVLDKIATILNYDFDNFLQKEQPYLTTEQINWLLKRGFTIGGHSIDHPLYMDITHEQQLMQTNTSIRLLQQVYGIDYKAFAFPFTDDGVKSRFFESVKEQQFVDISFGTAGLKDDECDFHFQRFPIELSTLSAKHQVTTEYLYYCLRSLMGKHVVRRK